ncbi:hypothetical protein AC249_AIPGENE25793 [Exaiptasia diaphana]|nr:hypothetical protein AC249_AIPGENE25793 [Exaiptasia diaphana]
MRANTSKLGDHPEYQYHEMTATEPKLCSALECIRKEALEDGWYRYGNTAVKLINENKTWNDAKTHCKSLGSDLVTILSPRQSDFIRQVVVKDIYDRTTKQKESSLPDELVDYWPLDGSDFDVQPRDKPGDARYEIIDGEMSLYLSGYNSFAEVPAVVFNPEGFTTMLWIKLLNNTRQLVTFYSDWYAPLTTFLMGVHYPYKGLFTWFRNFNGEMKTTYYLNYRFEEWVHVAVSYTNKTLPAIKIYYNGTLKQTTSISNLVRQTIHSKFHLGIKGDDFPNSPKTMHGYMKHLMVFNKTLNEEEIKRCIG